MCGDGVCGEGETDTSCFVDCGCGNGRVNSGEACDGSDLGGATCLSEGYSEGQLGCHADCEYDYSGCDAGHLCGDGIRTSDELCDGADLGSATCGSLGFEGGTLGCSDTCTLVADLCCNNDCDTAGEPRCSADQLDIETCTLQPSGCLGWEISTPCGADETCVDDGSSVYCESSCTDSCGPLGDSRCENNTVETCDIDADGCLAWLEETVCTAAQICTDHGQGPQCIAQGAGQSCSDVQYMNTPFSAVGWDFAADYGDAHSFTGPGCSNVSGPEAVFGLYLQQGEVLGARETAGSTVSIRLVEACAALPTTACLVDVQGYEESWTSLTFTAPNDGVYYVILEIEPNMFDPSLPLAYDLVVDRIDPAEITAGYWEEFGTGHLNDLEGCSLTFTPDASAMASYRYEYSCGLSAGFPVQPGSSADSTTLALGDNDFGEIPLTMAGGIDFYGVSYASLFVGSNGYVTFGAGDIARWASLALVPWYGLETMFGLPRIVGLFADLDPSQSGTIVVDRFSDHAVVTFDNVAVFAQASSVSFQIVIWSTGMIQVHYMHVGYVDGGMAGIASGGLYGGLPPWTNFMPEPPMPGQVVITELMWSPAAAADPQGEYLELYNSSDKPLRLEDCTVINGAGSLTVSDLFVIPAGNYAVLARDTDPAVNGGISDAQHLGGTLAPWDSTAETIQLTCQGSVIDELPWDTIGAWPAGGAGVSLQLMTSAHHFSLNDNPTFWCSSSTSYGSGDLGSPGAANSDCGATVLLEETFDFQIPPSWTVTDAGVDGVTWSFCDWPGNCGWNGTGSASAGGFASADGALGSLDGEMLDTPPLSGTSFTAVWLFFNHELHVTNAPYAEVQVSTDGVVWMPVATFLTGLVQQRDAIDLSAAAAGAPAFWIRFYYRQGSAFSNMWKIDDVSVIAW